MLGDRWKMLKFTRVLISPLILVNVDVDILLLLLVKVELLKELLLLLLLEMVLLEQLLWVEHGGLQFLLEWSLVLLQVLGLEHVLEKGRRVGWKRDDNGSVSIG